MSQLKPKPGDVLDGRWKLTEKLASGGVGSVFKAVDSATGDVVAVKVMHPNTAEMPYVRQKFLHEGKLAALLGQLGHVEVGVTASNVPFFAMSLLAGEDLGTMRDHAPGGRLPVEELVPIVAQVLDVLASAHRKGIVHCDVKPENVIVSNDGTAKIVDFGIALTRGGGHFPDNKFFGTEGYAPHEQVCGGRVDARSDVYSMGAVMHEMITGVQPELDGAMPKVKDAAPHCPTGIARVVDRALERDPTKRYPNAGAMRADLAPWVSEVSVVAPSPTTSGKSATKAPAVTQLKSHVLALMTRR